MTGWIREYINFLAYPPMQWYFVLSAAALGIFAFVRHKRRTPTTALNPAAMGSFLFPREIYRHRSTKTDLQYLLLVPIAALLLFWPAISILQAWVDGTASSTETVLGWFSAAADAELGSTGTGRTLAVVGFTILFAMAADLGFYLHHYAMHKIPFLWEFHKVHHSAEVLTPLTDYRAHPLESLTYGLFTGALLGVAKGTSLHLVGTGVATSTVLGMNVVFFAYYFMGYALRHSHFWISYGPVLNRIFVSPALHQIHHSEAPEHFDKNLGGAFALWDWAAGTLYLPKGEEDLTFGIGPETAKYRTPTDLLVRPFRANLTRSKTEAATAIALLACLGFFALQSLFAL